MRQKTEQKKNLYEHEKDNKSLKDVKYEAQTLEQRLFCDYCYWQYVLQRYTCRNVTERLAKKT